MRLGLGLGLGLGLKLGLGLGSCRSIRVGAQAAHAAIHTPSAHQASPCRAHHEGEGHRHSGGAVYTIRCFKQGRLLLTMISR